MAHKTYIHEPQDAKTAVLFIHGFLGSPEHFESFISLLPKNISVYNLLLKGHGGSVSDFGKASMNQWKLQIQETVKTLVQKYESIYIIAHSMGTFFAMESAINHPDKVKKIFLLQTPLKIGVKPSAALNTFKSLFNLFNKSKEALAYKKAHSIKLTLKFWEYIGWLPRYLELFAESKKARSSILTLETPCIIFQSKHDELVSFKSVKYIPKKQNITLHILQNSAHFIYSDSDLKFMYKTVLSELSD